jgi:signal transduction histidine kinase
VVDALGDSLAWPVAELWLVDDARQMLACAARWTGRDVADFCCTELEFDMGLPGKVRRTGAPQWIRDLAVDTGERSRLAARYGLHVAVGVPICSGGNVFGVLALYGDHVEDPEDSLTALLSGVAAQVGQHLERRRAEELTVELARTKDEFLALVAHELRNPLSVITSTVALFDEEIYELSAEQQRGYLATIARSAHRLSVMTGDLLDLARLESGHLAMHPADTDLADIIDQAVSTAGPAAASKDLTIAVYTDAHLPVCADADRLLQVADNLINNAIKYTPAGGKISIAAHRRSGHDGVQSITWDVTDTGIGIPAADRPRLFRRFYRASTALQHRIPGTGLGLVISRAIIERHQGSITVAEHDGPGTTFHIHLPVTTTV